MQTKRQLFSTLQCCTPGLFAHHVFTVRPSTYHQLTTVPSSNQSGQPSRIKVHELSSQTNARRSDHSRSQRLERVHNTGRTRRAGRPAAVAGGASSAARPLRVRLQRRNIGPPPTPQVKLPPEVENSAPLPWVFNVKQTKLDSEGGCHDCSFYVQLDGESRTRVGVRGEPREGFSNRRQVVRGEKNFVRWAWLIRGKRNCT